MVVLDSLLALFAGNAARQQSAFFERGSAQHVGLMHWSLSSMQDTSNQVASLVSHFLRVAEREVLTLDLTQAFLSALKLGLAAAFRVTFSIGG